MRSSRVEGVRADARQAGAGSSIFDDNEEQTHLRVHKQRPLTAEAACSSIKQHIVCTTPFDFSSFSVHASLASVGDGLSTALVLEMHLRA